MKLCLCRKLYFFVTLLFLFSCQTPSLKKKKLFNGSQGKYKYELITPNIIKVYSSKDGNLMKEGQVQTDCQNNSCDQDKIKEISLKQAESFLNKKQGNWKEYIYKDKKQFIKKKGVYKKNKREGVWEEYVQKKEDNGKWKNYLKRKGVYTKSKKEGVWEEYVQKKTNGGNWKNFLLKKLNYKNDKRTGSWERLRENGQILITGTYIDGLKENEEYKYSKENKKIELKIYLKGKLSGEYWKKDSKTEQFLTKGSYKGGSKDSVWTDYYKDGAIKKKRIYQKGKLNGAEKNYYPDKSLQSEGKNSNDHKIGKWKFYYPNGVQSAEGKYQYDSSKKKSLRVGIWKEYYNNGQLFATGPRKHTQTGKWNFYYPNKQKAAEGEMTTEFTMSEGTVYDKKGLVIGQGKFQFSIFRISPKGDSFKMKYKAGSPFTYYKEGKKYLEVQSNHQAIEYDSSGKKMAEGPVLPGSKKKNGCWSFTDGKKVYYMNNKVKKGKIAELQNCA